MEKRQPNQFNGICCTFFRFSNSHYCWFLCLSFLRVLIGSLNWKLLFPLPPFCQRLHFPLIWQILSLLSSLCILHPPSRGACHTHLSELIMLVSVSNCKLLIDSPHSAWKTARALPEPPWLKPNYAAKRGNFKCVLNIYDFVREHAHLPAHMAAHKCEKFCEKRKMKKAKAKILSTKLCCLAQREKQRENKKKMTKKKES